VGADLDPLFRHDQRAVEQREIADRAAAVYADGKGATGVNGYVFPDPDRVWSFAFEVTKDLRALAVKAFAEFDVRRDRLWPPIALDSPVDAYIAHRG
jgi:hypothetical protein